MTVQLVHSAAAAADVPDEDGGIVAAGVEPVADTVPGEALDAAAVPLQRVDELEAALLQLAHRDGAAVVPDEDVLGLVVVCEAGAPSRAHVAAQPLAGLRAVEVEVLVPAGAEQPAGGGGVAGPRDARLVGVVHPHAVHAVVVPSQTPLLHRAVLHTHKQQPGTNNQSRDNPSLI